MSTEPGNAALSYDAREAFKRGAFEGTVLRTYLVQNISAQVVRMARPGLLPEVPEGRSLEFRFRPKGNAVHVCRSGRTLLLVALQGKWIPFVGQAKTSKNQVHEIFDSFEETARQYP